MSPNASPNDGAVDVAESDRDAGQLDSSQPMESGSDTIADASFDSMESSSDTIADASVDSGEGSTPGDSSADAAVDCSSQTAGPAAAKAARSAGFTGTQVAYDGLYDVACTAPADCAAACVAAGGTSSTCSSGSGCALGPIPDAGSTCVPPSYWLEPTQGLSGSGTTMDAAEITLTSEQDADFLLVTDFGLTIPSRAVVRGIQFEVHLNSDSGLAADDTIEVVRGGSPAGANRAGTGPWPTALTYVTYGGPDDTWGLSWTATDVAASDFGIAIRPRYTDTAGNERAHVDAVRATVFYSGGCD
jgi:hypothetical protein